MPYTHYKQVDMEVDRLFDLGQYRQAIDVLQRAEQHFPEQMLLILFCQSYTYACLGDQAACLDAIERAQGMGFAWPIDAGLFEPVREHPRFPALLENMKQMLQQQAQVGAQMQYVVDLPEGYTPERRYPLFIVLHGDGSVTGNIEYQRWFWEPQELTSRGFIAVFAQSSQRVSASGYVWLNDYAVAREDIRACYEQVISQYPVDLEKVLIGGFSGGAITSLDITLAEVLPVRGFVALCPSLKPHAFTKENVLKAVQRGVRGVFLEGEHSLPVPDEQEMLAIFEEFGLPFQFIVNAGVGHVFPPDLGEKLGWAIDFIMDKTPGNVPGVR